MTAPEKPPVSEEEREARIRELEEKTSTSRDKVASLAEDFFNANPTEEQKKSIIGDVNEITKLEGKAEQLSENWNEYQDNVANDKNLNYPEKVVKLHEEYGKRNPGSGQSAEGADGLTQQEKNKSPEEIKVDQMREAYVNEYLKCKKEMGTKIAIERARTTISNTLTSVKNKFTKEKIAKEVFDEEKYFTDKYRESKKAYDQARIDMGNSLFNTKKSELVAAGLQSPQLEQELAQYKSTEILAKTILEERNKVIQAKIDGSPVSTATWKKLLQSYSKLSKTQKLLLSSSAFAVVGFLGTGATVGLAGATGVRLARGAFSMVASSAASKGIDQYNQKGNEKFEALQNEKKDQLAQKFGAGEMNQEQYEKEAGILDAESRKRARNQALVKAGVGVAIGAGIGFASHELTGHNLGNLPHSTGGSVHEGIVPKTDPIPGGDHITPPLPAHQIVEAQVGKGHGFIQTIRELKHKLETEYPDPTKRPESVQHILKTNETKLAIEYGGVKPGTNVVNESALTKVGWEFKVDESGNVTYQDVGGTHSTLLEKGTDIKATDTYKGEMFDSDHARTLHANHATAGFKDNSLYNRGNEYEEYLKTQKNPDGLSNFEKTHPQVDPQTVQTNIPKGVGPDATLGQNKVPNGLSDFEKAHPQVDPVGIQNGTPKVTDPNFIEDSSKNISPTSGAYEYSGDAGGGPISPTHGVYNTGGVRNMYPNAEKIPVQMQSGNMIDNNPNTSAPGNGFTREVPMTDKEAIETGYVEKPVGAPRQGAEQAISGQDTGRMIGTDPRHLQSAADVRHEFGRENVIIDKPETTTVDGIKYMNWSKATDHTFGVKGVKFDSYADYEKERELQELFGHAKQEVVYNTALDKNVDTITVDYFRESPEWSSTITKIPAKDFFDINTAHTTGTITDKDLNTLIDKGIVKLNVDDNGVSNYSFVHKDELERISKLYEKVDPLNAKPIGNENIEKYIGRLTRDIHKTQDGTEWAVKPKAAAIEKSLDDGTYAAVKERVRQQLQTTRIPTSNSIYPTGGYYYQGSSEYEPILNRAIGSIIMPEVLNRWTH